MNTTIQISLNDGTIITATNVSYNSTELAAKLNDPKNLMVQIGDIIVNKNAVKLIAPVQSA